MKTVIVGSGAIAYAHARACRELGIQILGIYDINLESAYRLANFCGSVPLNDLADYEAVLEQADMVHLCTPPSLRLQYAASAVQNDCHIIAEKPVAIRLDDAAEMVKMAEKNRVQIMVDYNHRFRSGFQKLLGIVRSGQIGEIIDVFIYRAGMLGSNTGTQNDTWRRKPGTVCGMSIESLSHDIDMIIQLAGPIKNVKADIRGTLPEVPAFDNNVHASFNLQSGAMALINASWSSHMKGARRGVIGTKGTVCLEGDDLFDFSRLRIKTNAMECEEVFKLNDTYQLETCSSYISATQHFLDIMEGRAENTVSGTYAMRTLEISHAILNAAREQNTVTI